MYVHSRRVVATTRYTKIHARVRIVNRRRSNKKLFTIYGTFYSFWSSPHRGHPLAHTNMTQALLTPSTLETELHFTHARFLSTKLFFS